MAQTDRYTILEDEPSPRIPICILVDKSDSMNAVTGGTPTGKTQESDGQTWSIVEGGTDKRIKTLLAGVSEYTSDILSDHRTKMSAEIAIVSFGSDVEICRDFEPADDSLKNFSIVAKDDDTQLGHAVSAALELIDRRKSDYQEYSITYYQPQIFIMTDGLASDLEQCEIASKEVQNRIREKKLVSFPFMIGDDVAGVDTLKTFAFEDNVFKVDAVNIVQLLKFLSMSTIRTSQTTAGVDEDESYRQMYEELKSGAVPVDAL